MYKKTVGVLCVYVCVFVATGWGGVDCGASHNVKQPLWHHREISLSQHSIKKHFPSVTHKQQHRRLWDSFSLSGKCCWQTHKHSCLLFPAGEPNTQQEMSAVLWFHNKIVRSAFWIECVLERWYSLILYSETRGKFWLSCCPPLYTGHELDACKCKMFVS